MISRLIKCLKVGNTDGSISIAKLLVTMSLAAVIRQRLYGSDYNAAYYDVFVTYHNDTM